MTLYLTATWLPPGGSSTVHIYIQTIHRTTQFTNEEECWPCPVFASHTLAFALQLRKKHGKKLSQGSNITFWTTFCSSVYVRQFLKNQHICWVTPTIHAGLHDTPGDKRTTLHNNIGNACMTLKFLGRSLCHWSLDVKCVDSTVYLSTCDITCTRSSPTHTVSEFNRHTCKGGQRHYDIISSYIHRKSWESGGRCWEVDSVLPT